MIITGKHLPRRTFLKGAGVSLALPLLDSMLPAQTPLSKTAAAARTRLSCIYVPHGATMDKWTPAAEGSGFEFSEILTPLEKLLTYATGRALKYTDMPAVRSIDRQAAKENNRFSSLIVGIVKSDAFQMRVKQADAAPTTVAQR